MDKLRDLKIRVYKSPEGEDVRRAGDYFKDDAVLEVSEDGKYLRAIPDSPGCGTWYVIVE